MTKYHTVNEVFHLKLLCPTHISRKQFRAFQPLHLAGRNEFHFFSNEHCKIIYFRLVVAAQK